MIMTHAEADCGICGLYTTVRPTGECQECRDREDREDARIADCEYRQEFGYGDYC
jgi:hypothetical protein